MGIQHHTECMAGPYVIFFCRFIIVIIVIRKIECPIFDLRPPTSDLRPPMESGQESGNGIFQSADCVPVMYVTALRGKVCV